MFRYIFNATSKYSDKLPVYPVKKRFKSTWDTSVANSYNKSLHWILKIWISICALRESTAKPHIATNILQVTTEVSLGYIISTQGLNLCESPTTIFRVKGKRHICGWGAGVWMCYRCLVVPCWYLHIPDKGIIIPSWTILRLSTFRRIWLFSYALFYLSLFCFFPHVHPWPYVLIVGATLL